jgi:hypothetical protein
MRGVEPLWHRLIREHNHVQILVRDESSVPVGPSTRPWRHCPCLAVTRWEVVSARSLRGQRHTSCLRLSCFETAAAQRNSQARHKGPAESVNQPSSEKRTLTKLVGSGRCRLRTNREGCCGRGLCVPWRARIRRVRPQSLPTPLPGAASGCNVKPNAQTAATEAAAASLAVILLAGILDLLDRSPLPFTSHIKDL